MTSRSKTRPDQAKPPRCALEAKHSQVTRRTTNPPSPVARQACLCLSGCPHRRRLPMGSPGLSICDQRTRIRWIEPKLNWDPAVMASRREDGKLTDGVAVRVLPQVLPYLLGSVRAVHWPEVDKHALVLWLRYSAGRYSATPARPALLHPTPCESPVEALQSPVKRL